MVRGIVAATAVVLLAGTASAADLGRMPVKAAPMMMVAPAYNWSGFYAGANIGYGWGKVKDDWGDSLNTSGVIGGGQIGYNWQFSNNWLVGIEGQFSGADIKKSMSWTDPTDPTSFARGSVNAKWVGAITGRVGYAASNWLYYAKVGGAWADYRATESWSDGSVWSASKTVSGWTAGAGAEWGFAPNWSALIEYQYYDFGNNAFDNGDRWSAKLDIHTIKVGVNYHFTGF